MNEVERRELQETKFVGMQDGIDFVRCQFVFGNGSICNWPDTRISGHLKAVHNCDRDKYLKLYPSALITCKKLKMKTAFHGTHSEETKKNMAKSHLGIKPWNKGLNKLTNERVKQQAITMKETLANKKNDA